MNSTSLVERWVSTASSLAQPFRMLLLLAVCALYSDLLLAQSIIRQDVLTRPAAAQDRDPPSNGTRSVSESAPNAFEKLDINTATAEQLDELLPGIGPEKARRIIEWRTTYGPFQSLDQLLEVSGIGPKTLENIRPFLTLGESISTSGLYFQANTVESQAKMAVQRIVATAQRDARLAGQASTQ